MSLPVKRICFYTVATHLGGAERSLFDIVTRLAEVSKFEYQPWVLLPKSTGPLVDSLRENQIAYSILPMPKFFLQMSRSTPWRTFCFGLLALPGILLYIYNLLKLWREENIVLIHTTGIKCHLLAAFLKPLHRKKVIWHLRDILKKDKLRVFLNHLRKAAGVFLISNSHASERSLVLDEKLDTRIKEVVYNGIDPKQFFPQPTSRYREVFRVSPQMPIIGIVGVLASWKGQIEFVRMASILISMGIEARYVIVGDQIYDTIGDQDFRKVLDQEIEKLNLGNYFYFAKFEKDAARAINGLDVLVHASIRPEPFGRVIVEGMACGVPVVASAAGGVLEILQNRKSGCFFQPGDLIEMARIVKEVIIDGELRSTLIQNARSVFLDQFTLDASLKKILLVYRRVLS